jgi:hypothetical protein
VEELLLSAVECTRGRYVRQTGMHIVEPFVPETSASDFETAIGNLTKYTSPGFVQFPGDLSQTGGESLR